MLINVLNIIVLHCTLELRSLGLVPDFIVGRAAEEVTAFAREKIALFCNVREETVLSVHDVPNIYHVPLLLLKQNFTTLIAERLGLNSNCKTSSSSPPPAEPTLINADRVATGVPLPVEAVELNSSMLRAWTDMANSVDCASAEAVIALVGKYTAQLDAYLSVISALKHACIATAQKLRLVMVKSSDLEEETRLLHPQQHRDAWEKLKSAQGILVPGGFGERGIEGKIDAIRYAREQKVPFLGICLGMQAAVIEYARAFLNKPHANSMEFDESLRAEDCAVVFMPEGHRERKGGTMRLGMRRTLLQPGSAASALYGGSEEVLERHRHRYEVNPAFIPLLEARGMRFTGRDEAGERMEVVELAATPDTPSSGAAVAEAEEVQQHPYFIGVQFHPEFASRPLRPSPVFKGLLEAVKKATK